MKTIAIVEDDIYIAGMLAELLGANGYRTVRAATGTEALLRIEEEHPDLVILDLMLPGLNGEEVLRRIGGRCPVIILSAKTDVRGKVANLNAGAVDYITKPFDNDELLARIGVQLRGRVQTSRISLGGITMDLDTFAVFTLCLRLLSCRVHILRL